jgi:hypothetical protein
MSVNYVTDLEVVSIDLNAGAGGEYIYLYFKKGDNNPITGLFVITGNNPGIFPPPGYTKIEVDLNAGAGGEYIYLCYTKDPRWLSIKEVAIVASNNVPVPPPLGYNLIPVDLNVGAGGEYIFLCYQN